MGLDLPILIYLTLYPYPGVLELFPPLAEVVGTTTREECWCHPGPSSDP